MTRHVRLRLLALADIEEGREQFERLRDGLGDEFEDAVEEVLNWLEDFPMLYGRVKGEVRAAVIPRFHYVLFYQILIDKIDVFAVLPGSRRSTEWERRI